MSNLTFVATLVAVLLLGGTDPKPRSTQSCTPSYRESDGLVKVPIDAFSELSFRILAIGCNEDFERAWPPEKGLVEKEFSLELQEPHPVQIALMIRDRSPELRARLAKRLNNVLKEPVVYDVFLFDATAAESF